MGKKGTNLYTFEDVKHASEGFATKKEFREANPSMYAYALNHKFPNGDKYMDHLGLRDAQNPRTDPIYEVYVYPFYVTKSVYVGITHRETKRKNQHRGKYKCTDSAVFKHAQEHGFETPDMLMFEGGLYWFEAQWFEDFLKKFYKGLGWNVLNKGATGIGKGSLGASITVKNSDIKRLAKKFTTKAEFMKAYPKECQIAYRRGIINDIGLKDAKVPDGTYTEEFCWEIARKCKFVEDIRNMENGESIYTAMTKKKNRWRRDYWWLFAKDEIPVIVSKGFKIKIYKSVNDCKRKTGFSRNAITASISNRTRLHGWLFTRLNVEDIDFNIPDFEHRNLSYIKRAQ